MSAPTAHGCGSPAAPADDLATRPVVIAAGDAYADLLDGQAADVADPEPSCRAVEAHRNGLRNSMARSLRGAGVLTMDCRWARCRRVRRRILPLRDARSWAYVRLSRASVVAEVAVAPTQSFGPG
jgi:hypothetical protein